MNKFVVKEIEGKIILVSENWSMETDTIHSEIWKKNYLQQEIVEGKNFHTKEIEIGEDTFQVIAYPTIISSCKE